VKWMNVLESRKAVQNQGELFRERLLCIFDLSSIEIYK
jgi:hypothetical protein